MDKVLVLKSEYVIFLANVYTKIDTVKNINTFLALFENPNDVEIIQTIDISDIPFENFIITDKDLESRVYIIDWKIIHKTFRMLYVETSSGPFFAFIIPHKSYSEWVEAEFKFAKGEFSGERSLLNKSVNPNASIVFINKSEVDYPIVFLAKTNELLKNTLYTKELMRATMSNLEL